MQFLDLIRSYFGPDRREATPGTRLHIEITVSGELRKPVAVYRLVRADPPVASAESVVSRDGNIDLNAIGDTRADNLLTQFTFTLNGKLSFEGREHPAVFRRPACIAFNVRRETGGPPPPGLFRAFFPERDDPAQLAVLDQNDDGGRYRYCLRIRARDAFWLWGKLDPSIINR